MLQVAVNPKQGNIAARVFPISGYFGVTPVVLAGTVLLKVQEGGHAIPVRSVQVAVRCYEAKEGGMRSSRERTVWEMVRYVWQPPPGTQDQVLDLDDWRQPFKLVIPPEVADIAHGKQTLREWRVRWRLEVTVEHVPIAHVGHRVAQAYDVHIHNYRSPSPSLPSPPAPMLLGSGPTAIHVHINPPAVACGPSEQLAVSFSIRPEDLSASIKKLQVVLDRRLELLDDRDSSGSGSSEDLPNVRRNRVPNIFRGGGSPHSSRNTLEESKRVVVTRIAEAQCEVPKPSASGALWSIGSLQLPRRSHSWDIGETERTAFADISFEVRLKITLKSKRGGSPKELVSHPVPVLVRGTSAEERANAQRARETLESQGPSSKRRLVTRSRKDCDGVYHQENSSSGTVSSKYDRETTPPHKAANGSADRLPSPATSTDGADMTLPSIHSFLDYSRGRTPASSTSNLSVSMVSESDPLIHIPKRRSSRAVSNTSQDDDDDAARRARQKLDRASEPPYAPSMIETTPSGQRRRRLNLPSLDALGLGLPKVNEERPLRYERPSTAPSFGVYAAKPPPFGSRPTTSSGPPSSFAFAIPAPRR